MIFFFVSLLVVCVVARQKVEGASYDLAYDYALYDNVLDPELCQKHLQEMAAFEFYDASFRIPQGILRGSSFNLGNYHQCLSIEQPLEDTTVKGKYCLIQTESLSLPILTGDSWFGNVTWIELYKGGFHQGLEAYEQAKQKIAILSGERVMDIIVIGNVVPMTLAVCIPRACAVEEALSPWVNNSVIDFNYTALSCRLPDDKPYTGADIALVVIFSIIGCLTLLSTAYELNHKFIQKESTKPSVLLSCFSLYTNTDRLMTISSKPGALDCLDGVRSLSTLWVIVGHTFLMYLTSYVTNRLDTNDWIQKLNSVWIMGANISVDSFFALSGLLLVYTAANKMKPMQLLKNLHLFYLNRLLRMFPLLATTVLIQSSVLHQVSDGVRWDRVALQTQNCRDWWWSALLHIQNLVNPQSMCLPHAWYLSVDVQLHILSPLILFWALGSRRAAWSGLTAGLLASLVATVTYCFIKEFTGAHNIQYTTYFNNNPFTRSPVFIIGMLFGYMLHISRGKQVKMPPWLVTICHLLAIGASWYCMYQVSADWQGRLYTTLNIALMRSAWGAALCWLIYACVNGYAGPINWFLSLKVWKFTARISYAMYLFHYPIQFVMNGADIMPSYFTFEFIFLRYASDLVYTIIVSTAACMIFDAPFGTLQKMIISAITPSSPVKVTSDKEMPETKNIESNKKLNGNKSKESRIEE